MKKSDANIERRIEDTIVALDHIKKASPRPFLYARIKARMDSKKVMQESFYISPFLRYATICMIILMASINLLTASQFLGQSTIPESINSDLEELTKEYYSEVITIDNLENYLNE